MMRALITLAVLLCGQANAEPFAQVQSVDGVRIVLYREDCALSAITNLPGRATWEDNGKVFEGCWGVRPNMSVVLMYFDDKTVAAIPISSFERPGGV